MAICCTLSLLPRAIALIAHRSPKRSRRISCCACNSRWLTPVLRDTASRTNWRSLFTTGGVKFGDHAEQGRLIVALVFDRDSDIAAAKVAADWRRHIYGAVVSLILRAGSRSEQASSQEKTKDQFRRGDHCAEMLAFIRTAFNRCFFAGNSPPYRCRANVTISSF